MTIQARPEGNAIVVALGGRLDGVTCTEYDSAMRKLIDGGATRLVVDFAQLDYISSAGLGELILTAKLLKEKEGHFCVANVHGNVLSVFEMCGIRNLLQVHGSVADALAAVA